MMANKLETAPDKPTSEVKCCHYFFPWLYGYPHEFQTLWINDRSWY